jgi:type II restriction/modification system DNA methylase subunit YeeA
MDTGGLKKFAQEARTNLRQQVAARLDQVLAEQSAARRSHPVAVSKLEAQIGASSRDQVVEQVAYTWFNRFSALCFMDACGHTSPRVLTPRAGETRPEILSEAMAGVMGDEVPPATAQVVRDLLDGRVSSPDPQGEAYQKLVVAACNHWNGAMPFLFEATDDPTELLMPSDLLAEGSVIGKMRTVMTEEACQDVEIIGWLYQFYISEKKDQVFAGLKKNVKITPENIPAATQLFTPHWIVRYLVENSLGRLWLLNRPASKLAAQMDYYIAPEEPETDFLKITKPEEIKICDPACGSGHMLTYAFDLLYAIYEEEGYYPAEIPGLILTRNLYGIEIDDRAGALAAFALTMKAAARKRRFLRNPVQPNILVMENVAFEAQELADYISVAGRDLFTGPLRDTLGQFAQAKNFGALITPSLPDVAEARRVLAAKDFTSDLIRRETHARVLRALEMADYLSPRYHVVVANPPYAGARGVNESLGSYLKLNFDSGKHDLFSAFILRVKALTASSGFAGIMSPNVWMYISSYEEVRRNFLREVSLNGLVELPLSGFKGATVQICAFTFQRNKSIKKSNFIRLVGLSGGDPEMGRFTSEAAKGLTTSYTFLIEQDSFNSVPTAIFAYWLSPHSLGIFRSAAELRAIAEPRQGLATSDNGRFLRNWYEVSVKKICFGAATQGEANTVNQKWIPYNKGGAFRRWYGNNEHIINWENEGLEVLAYASKLYGSPTRTIKNIQYYFRQGITWTYINSTYLGMRHSPQGFIFDVAGSSVFPPPKYHWALLGYLCSSVAKKYIDVINPTLNIQAGSVGRLPIVMDALSAVDPSAPKSAVAASKKDWDAYETSWDFTTLPLLGANHRAVTLAATYGTLREHWQGMTLEMQRLEEENNRIFIDAYGLQDELTPEVPLNEITLTCNPAYRYGGKKSYAELETQLRADTMAEFLHYAVGCMFGRYSLDAPGLILANQGDTLAEYLAKVPEPSFIPDADNVIPMLDRDWFGDDITERFRKFLRITFGEERFQENLAFIEEALGKDVRRWFTKDFFDYHVRRFKKRPIYWLFTSPKGTFNALIYLHRYNESTISTVLTEYVRPLRDKLEAHRKDLDRIAIDPDASVAERRASEKEAPEITKQIAELEAWERDTLLPMAQRRISIDLDDGVKTNYPKFAGALKAIKGLDESDD